MLKNIINRMFDRKKNIDPNYGLCWITEKPVVYADRAGTTNKEFHVVEKSISEELANVFEFSPINDLKDGLKRSSVVRDIANRRMLTQDEKFVRIFRNGKIVQPVEFFEKEGYKKGDIYAFERLGFMGNIEKIGRVACVTDQYVLFFSLDERTLYAHSYPELDSLQPALKK